MNEQTLFTAAIEHDPGTRSAYLDDACGTDNELRERVEKLIGLHEQAGSFLNLPAANNSPTIDQPPLEKPGSQIGPYKLLQQIGEGGMGTVYMAEQTLPVHRKVAIKVIKAGMDSRQVIARFEAERQALAMMDHVNIARVLDAGTTEQGRPYFVMELIHGVPITKYCDDNHLTPRERLELFVPVCQAIQHAHQKGIIHRDIKPSNVMITLYDGKPVPKVIDFGVAKATEQKLTERTLFTQYGTMIGTLEYMSPEQAEMSALGVDTRSDVYSLGVLLYELLTGSTPLTHKRMKEAAYGEILRMIKEEEPPKPSTRLSDSGEALASISANRHTEPAKLTKLVKGELDWIVMKCLEKDRNRRYETANGFAADVQRYLDDEQVQACPPSVGYRLRKFVRRNRGPVLAGAIIVLVLVCGIVGTSLGLVAARSQRDAAEIARLDEAREKNRAVAAEKLASDRLAQVEAEQKRTEEERAVALAIAEFLQKDLLGQADVRNQPFGAGLPERNPKITVRELLDRAERAIAGKFADQPIVEAAVRQTLADTYGGLGEFALAIPHAERALELRRATLGPDHGNTLESLNNRGLLYLLSGDVKKATEILEQVLPARQQQFGPEAPETLVTKQHLAMTYLVGKKFTDAINLLEQVRAVRVKKPGLNHRDTLRTLSILASAYAADGKPNEAIEILLSVREAMGKDYGPDDPETVLMLGSFGEAYLRAGKTAEAIDMLTKAHDAFVRKQNTEHPGALAILTNLAAAHLADGNLKQALPRFQQAAASVEKLKFLHVAAGDIVGNLSGCHELLKQYPEAEVWRRKWLAFVKEKDGPESGPYAGALIGLGDNLLKQKKYADAEPILRDAQRIVKKLQPRAWTTFLADSLVGDALLGQKKYPEAEPVLLSGYGGMKQREAAISPQSKVRVTEALVRLVQLYDAWGKPDEAAKWRKELEAHGRPQKTP